MKYEVKTACDGFIVEADAAIVESDHISFFKEGEEVFVVSKNCWYLHRIIKE